MDWEALIAAGCQFLDGLIGSLGTILMLALTFGLVCLSVGLTVAVLWKEGWMRFWAHLKDTARLYFRRIRWYGHTHASTWTAVACSLVIWLGIAVSFTFTAHWRTCMAILFSLPVVFLTVGWCLGGPRATNHKLRFVCSFFEPAVALAIPSLTGKFVDAGLKAFATGL